MVQSARFNLWFKPREEQAGGQKGRGCEEQVLIVRLLVDIARKSGRTLYMAFIDYQKAYDKLDRLKLLRLLDAKGCGNRFLKAIKESLRSSVSVIGSSTFCANMGVKQGGRRAVPFLPSTLIQQWKKCRRNQMMTGSNRYICYCSWMILLCLPLQKKNWFLS